jgi:hypothetical protein
LYGASFSRKICFSLSVILYLIKEIFSLLESTVSHIATTASPKSGCGTAKKIIINF